MTAQAQLISFAERPAKITTAHLERQACIYIRQSSLKQVERNRESQVNQYQLVQRAAALGWPDQRIRVIDRDLGLSGQDATARQGFQELVAEVSLGQVGIIFGYEVSRLARNNSDWYHLLDLAALFGTLIADTDGIYDPRLYNDRLLLGLKGTMSEAELHLIRQRMDAGRLTQIQRGAYRQTLPTGLIRLPDGTVVKDPDDQVRHTIELVFSQFAALGSCHQVLRKLQREQILLPRRQVFGIHKGQLLWKPPSSGAIYAIVHNPAYAGAFAYGRRQTDPTRRQLGRPGSGQLHRPMAGWITLQQDVYPAYISWEQYLANQARLQQNATQFRPLAVAGQGAAREGAALLQGLAMCGCCGRHMRVVYKGPHRYTCQALNHEFGMPMCASLHGPSIDAVVVQAFFEALAPAQLNALEAVLAEQQNERTQLDRQWRERLKRAEYNAQLAQRQYDAVDPDNRLVARELERRWEEQLRQLQETQAGYERFVQAAAPFGLSAAVRQQLEHISESLPDLWYSGQITPGQQKELLRSLISRVILKRTAPDQMAVTIVWVSGHYSELTVQPPIQRGRDLAGYATLVERVHALWEQGQTDEQIATQVTAEGFRTARRSSVSSTAVKHIRLDHSWQRPLAQSWDAQTLEGYLTPAGLAAKLGVPRRWVYQRIASGRIASPYLTRHPQSNVYLIHEDPSLLAYLRQLL
jgi:DNA invertase Pin-like site-specific DNA recombinase